ncbi:MAG: hypothetical protein ACI87O_003002 [Planctomycetota bacterium]
MAKIAALYPLVHGAPVEPASKLTLERLAVLDQGDFQRRFHAFVGKLHRTHLNFQSATHIPNQEMSAGQGVQDRGIAMILQVARNGGGIQSQRQVALAQRALRIHDVPLSLVMTAKAIGINPQIYLRDIQSRLAHETDARKLTPHGWKEHFSEQVEYERRVVVATFA